jgi:hypothetical protein
MTTPPEPPETGDAAEAPGRTAPDAPAGSVAVRRWPEPGPLAEEAARLAEAATDWARRAMPEVVALLRGDRPEVTGKLVEAGAAVAAAARAVLDALARPAPGRPDPAGPGPAEPPEPPGRRVEPIDVE